MPQFVAGTNASDTDGIKKIAKDMTDDMMTFYPGNKPGGTPGYIPLPYYCESRLFSPHDR